MGYILSGYVLSEEIFKFKEFELQLQSPSHNLEKYYLVTNSHGVVLSPTSLIEVYPVTDNLAVIQTTKYSGSYSKVMPKSFKLGWYMGKLGNTKRDDKYSCFEDYYQYLLDNSSLNDGQYIYEALSFSPYSDTLVRVNCKKYTVYTADYILNNCCKDLDFNPILKILGG